MAIVRAEWLEAILNLKIFHHQIIQVCRRMRLKYKDFSNTYENCFFFKKKEVVFFGKNLIFVIKIAKGGKFAVECVSNDIFSWKYLFCFNCEVFLQKIKKIGKLQNLMKKDYFLKKKRFYFFWKASLTKLVDVKYAGDSLVFHFIYSL